jgi:hypothetical protein
MEGIFAYHFISKKSSFKYTDLITNKNNYLSASWIQLWIPNGIMNHSKVIFRALTIVDWPLICE